MTPCNLFQELTRKDILGCRFHTDATMLNWIWHILRTVCWPKLKIIRSTIKTGFLPQELPSILQYDSTYLVWELLRHRKTCRKRTVMLEKSKGTDIAYLKILTFLSTTEFSDIVISKM
jgi:hypothetical protein